MFRNYKTFEDIKAWQLGREFRKDIYDVTKKYPKEEQYVLTPQSRRAVISITSNIAEGFGRFTFKDNINFCIIARGSVNETLDHLHTALDENYITKSEYQKLYIQGRDVERAINGYIKFLHGLRQNKT